MNFLKSLCIIASDWLRNWCATNQKHCLKSRVYSWQLSSTYQGLGLGTYREGRRNSVIVYDIIFQLILAVFGFFGENLSKKRLRQ